MQDARPFLVATSENPGLMQKEGKVLARSPLRSLLVWHWEISAKDQPHHLCLASQKTSLSDSGISRNVTAIPALGLHSSNSTPLSLENVDFVAHSKPSVFISSPAFTTRRGNQLWGPSGFQYHGEKRGVRDEGACSSPSCCPPPSPPSHCLGKREQDLT